MNSIYTDLKKKIQNDLLKWKVVQCSEMEFLILWDLNAFFLRFFFFNLFVTF